MTTQHHQNRLLYVWNHIFDRDISHKEWPKFEYGNNKIIFGNFENSLISST